MTPCRFSEHKTSFRGKRFLTVASNCLLSTFAIVRITGKAGANACVYRAGQNLISH